MRRSILNYLELRVDLQHRIYNLWIAAEFALKVVALGSVPFFPFFKGKRPLFSLACRRRRRPCGLKKNKGK